MNKSFYFVRKYRKKAFSLIELSIVILIIGIALGGITQSSRLIASFKLAAARSLTNSSSVSSIFGLVAWWDSTSESAFLNEEADSDLKVSVWKDINPSSASKYSATQSNNADKPIYTIDAINGLPALKFNGSQYLATEYSSDLNSSTFTIFAVVKTIDCDSYCAIINERYSSPQQGFTLYANSTNSYEFWIGDGSFWSGAYANSTPYSALKTDLLTATYNGSTRYLYFNGAESESSNTSSYIPHSNSSIPLRIGAGSEENVGYFYHGYIGELILFNRALKTEERASVENYLRKKWGII